MLEIKFKFVVEKFDKLME